MPAWNDKPQKCSSFHASTESDRVTASSSSSSFFSSFFFCGGKRTPCFPTTQTQEKKGEFKAIISPLLLSFLGGKGERERKRLLEQWWEFRVSPDSIFFLSPFFLLPPETQFWVLGEFKKSHGLATAEKRGKKRKLFVGEFTTLGLMVYKSGVAKRKLGIPSHFEAYHTHLLGFPAICLPLRILKTKSFALFSFVYFPGIPPA